ncbi:MAG: DUF1501 domain-containing protein [Verrucomicrobiota bacterium]
MKSILPLLPLDAALSRRALFRYSFLTTAAMMLGQRSGFSLPTTTVQPAAKAEAVIQIWLWGGPCHIDTFDPKPNAGYDFCGPLNEAIATNVDGIRIGKLLPKLAGQADKFSLIRSMTHENNGHETASYMVQTGHLEGDHLVYPSMGAVVSLLKGYDAGYKGLLPPYIVLTEPQGRFSEAGFLGPRYKPFATGGDPAKTPFAVEGIVAEGISPEYQSLRRELLGRLDTLGKQFQNDPRFVEYRKTGEAAYDMILGAGAEVFDLTKESDELRNSYGRNTFGQSCLAARRLVERGARYVTINYKGWDTHKQHFQTMNRKLPELDQGLATLLQDLSERGLLSKTIVWCGGEFGRTPRVQWEAPWNGGRGHCGKVFSTLVAGGGFRGGHVVGASDARGESVADRPVYPWDLTASMYELLGIDPDATFPRNDDESVRLTPKITGNIKSGGRLKEIM